MAPLTPVAVEINIRFRRPSASFSTMVASFWSAVTSVLLLTVMPTSAGPVQMEYCEREVFEARCPDGEVVLVQSAVYGRMKLSRCVRQEYGSIGCKVNVLPVVDAKCSGRQECRFHTSELHKHSPCPGELVAFLEASYECVRVTTCEGDVCSAGSFVRISSSSGYLASSDPSSGRCGSPKCPWVLAPQRGQRFNLTFYSFLPPEQSDKYCQRLASIVDKAAKFSKDVTICSGQEGRTVTQTTPESVPVDVIMYGPVSPDNPTFSLLRYEAIGCPDITPPAGGWMKRDGDLLTVGCDRIRRTWHLTCDGVLWVGEIGLCNEDLAQTAIESQESWDIGIALQQASTSTQGLLLIVGIGIVLGILLGFSMLAVAVVLIKRRRRQARLELREACMVQLSKSDLAASNPNNLYNQSTMSSGGYGPVAEKLSLTNDGAYQPHVGADLLTGQSEFSSRPTSIRILAPCRGQSPPRGFPPPPPPPAQLCTAGCIDPTTRIPS